MQVLCACLAVQQIFMLINTHVIDEEWLRKDGIINTSNLDAFALPCRGRAELRLEECAVGAARLSLAWTDE